MLSKITSRMSAMQIIATGYFLIIMTGTCLLLLPFASRPGTSTSFLTALFTATSATCVTGLVVVDTFSQWTIFGQLAILTMIQIGGLGFITMGITISMILGKKIGLRERGMIRESFNILELGGIVRLTKRVIKGTFLIEFTGAAILSTQFIPEFGPVRGIYYSFFHSISAFCNAGFDLMGRLKPFSSLTHFYNNPIVTGTIMCLIVIGGIGFLVWNDIINYKFQFRKFSLHTKMVLTATIVLIFISALLFYFIEHDRLFAGMSPMEKTLNSFFCAITPRTAGYNTVDTSHMTDAGKLLTIILMFIGGAPGSTAGGVKVTTIFVLLIFLKANFARTIGSNVFGRRLENEAIQKASAVFCTNLFLAIMASIVICSMQNFNGIDALLEVFSAIGTVGMSAGISPLLNIPSQLIVIMLMYLGRVGSLSFAISLNSRKKVAHIMQPAEKITIG